MQAEEEEEEAERKEEEFPPLPRREAALPVSFPSCPLRPGCGSGWSLKKGEDLETKTVEEGEEGDVLHPSRTHLLPRPPLLPPPPPS